MGFQISGFDHQRGSNKDGDMITKQNSKLVFSRDGWWLILVDDDPIHFLGDFLA